MATSIMIYWKACIDQNRELRPEDEFPGTLIEVEHLPQNETVETIKIEIDAKINDLKSEIIETLRKDIFRKTMKR